MRINKGIVHVVSWRQLPCATQPTAFAFTTKPQLSVHWVKGSMLYKVKTSFIELYLFMYVKFQNRYLKDSNSGICVFIVRKKLVFKKLWIFLSLFQCSSTYFHDKSKCHLQNWILDLCTCVPKYYKCTNEFFIHSETS